MVQAFARARLAAGILGFGTLAAVAAPLPCDDGLKDAIAKASPDTRVVLVKAFAKGEDVKLEKSPTPFTKAATDLCLVKLMVGPGKPGKAGAPSTSPGIGIEVMLPAPAAWNKILRARGSGGWAGGHHGTTTAIGLDGGLDTTFNAEVAKGYVVSQSDHGYPSMLARRDASFTLDEDGSFNTVLWKDFSERAIHEMAVKTKLLAKLYYDEPHRYAYWDGFSTGGRQGLKAAQIYPDDYDGILAGAPAINWTKFITGELYPQVVMQRDLGGVIDLRKLDTVGAAATSACGGDKLGFISDPQSCRYDPTRDAKVLCASENVDGKPGTGAAGSCVTLAEARAINKIWYGMTSDGSAADPNADNGMSAFLDGRRHLWWGLTRGTRLNQLAGPAPFPIATAQVALSLQNPAFAQKGPFLKSEVAGTGADRWKELDYAGLTDAFMLGDLLQQPFANINTDTADLSAYRRAGKKIVMYHGWADDLIPPQGTVNYALRTAAAVGGHGEAQKFIRLYMIPGHAHDSKFNRAASLDPETGAATVPAKVPLPQDGRGRDELFLALRAWVENGVAPGRIDIASAGNGAVTMPICVFPAKATYKGAGEVTAAASYECR